ncbi:unnamed protein product [Effrenium voratum]|uniref:PA14 domain-containing protein n=1 Tax=Effrenium voratum TaxID=2562239 RepID=A0AA36IMX7_9DINO|nr:unnamed protein product [Effrenium voratum]
MAGHKGSRFFLKSNDGSRLVIDGQQVIDNGGYHSTNEESGELNLTAGSHTLLVEYFQGTSTSNIEFKWQGPDSGEVKQLVPGSVFSTKPASKCPDCGSPGEVANQPNLGHQFRFFTTEDHIDSDLDNHFFDRMDRELSKSAVWTAKAMGAEDQLRQRVAWALSQIFVVSANGFGGDSRTEVWLNYYDMFLRHAFGNFRDLLQEVTYNPLMGEYLTNTGSSSYDHNGRFPNENYAREIMQLFTIGLDMLHPNGTAKVTAAGDKVPTYGMEEIVSFSKVFTGFKQRPFRANIENYDDDNLIDPLKMSAGRHDKHPKMDLYGGYLGDGYPMCSDFVGLVSKGSKFLYHTGFLDNALELPADSQLRTALCASDGAGCVYPAAVELTEDLVCGGAECGATVRAVKVDGRFYRYVPPPCVQNYVSPLVVNGSSYYPLGPGQYCPEGSLVTDYAECEAAILAVHGGHDGNPKTSATQWAPKGCSWRSNRMYINPHETGRASGGSYLPICKAYVWVHTDGRVSIEGSEANNFKVHWTGPVPAGQQLISVSSAAVFNAVPSKAEVLALPVGAPKPSVACSVCGDVQVFHPANDGPAIGSSAVFGVEGRYFRNLRHSVDLGAASFRNPPVFLKAQKGLLAEEAALAEVECLLDQLFQHNNTAVFIGKRLIQRFGTSNPSAAYVEAVAKAFRTGAIASGEVFSGKYGDLGATVAEILLHEHGDFEGHLHRQFHGSLREPMLKLIHFLRSMEYVDAKQELVVFEELQDVLGQFPFQSPSVFNFYLADFNLPEPEPENASMNMTGGLPEPEPEAEGLVAPELQILIPPHFIGFLNGMSSMIKYGVNYKCDAVRGFGERANPYVGLESRDVCPMGTFQVPDLGENETLEELDVLLTGGRLTEVAKEAARRAYRTAPASEKMKRAQTAVMMTPEFNTFGDPLPKAEARPELNASQASAQLPYRATVFLFLAGGADTWNMLVPQNCDLYQEYVDVRTDLHLNPSDLIEVNVSGQPCAKFGIHGSYGYLKQLYDEKDLAFMTNMGSLVEPLTKEQYRSSSKQTCVGLFSHSDQQTGAQTLQCQTPGNTPRGAGGRMADALNAQNPPVQAASFSVAGSAIFAQGVVTNRQIVSEEGNKRFGEFELWRETISNITKQQHANVFSEQYTKIFLDSLRGTEELGRAFEEVELATNYDTSSKLAKQLSQVAKLMKVREVRKAERDFFFVQVGGWDMHSNLLTSLTNKFADINSALEGFVAEMKAQNIWNSVALASSSEFARTLDSNGGGSDHAWAGQHFVIGGKVRGGKVLNKYPSTLKEGAYNDIGRGRLIPEYPWESMLVPIAEWMGLNTADGASMTQVFPNFARFNSSTVQGADFLFKP